MRTILAIFSILILGSAFQRPTPKSVAMHGDYRFMFYNCENLFDTIDDPKTRDDEFTPKGAKHWTTYKYYKKVHNIAKVITAVGGWDLPDMVGLCEIENKAVVEDIILKTHLKKADYRIIHYESTDKRGIDVGMLYNKTTIFPIKSMPIRINFPFGAYKNTRDILYVKAATKDKDTLHVFFNHWPSRWGGQLPSEELRMYVASVLKSKVDSVFATDSLANVLIMGDLNDYPTNKSLTETLQARHDYEQAKVGKLYNLAWYLQEKEGLGSHKHEGMWGVLDQTVISGALLKGSSGLYTTPGDAHVFNVPYLLEDDLAYSGKITNRTYIGYKFHGGYSDHLPVYVDFFNTKKEIK